VILTVFIPTVQAGLLCLWLACSCSSGLVLIIWMKCWCTQHNS